MHRQLLCMAQVDPEEVPSMPFTISYILALLSLSFVSDLPQEVDCYHRLVPLETSIGMDRPSYFGVVTSAYKANSTKNGLAYCLRRIHSKRIDQLVGLRMGSVFLFWLECVNTR